MSTRTVVTFNGTVLTNNYHVSDMQVALLPREIASVDVPGMDGSHFTGQTLSAKDITLTLTSMGRSIAARQQAARALAAILAVDEPKPLSISIDGGLYYMAIPTSDSVAEIYRNATRFDVTFRALDPVMYGTEHTESLTNSTDKTLTIPGTYPALPIIEAESTHGASSSNQYVRITNNTTGEYVEVPCAYSGTHTVVVDCAKRSAKVDGAEVGITPQSDWIALNPGQVSLQRTYGTGTFNVTYKERWL